MRALEVLRDLRRTGSPASPQQRQVLARWTSWGAIPKVFDDADAQLRDPRERLEELLTASERAQARATVLSAHFTDPRLAASMWHSVQRLGFTGGPVLEPGCGSGIFLALAPEGADPVGVEVDAVTAEIAAHLNPHAQVRAQSFADSRFETRFAAVLGNVPYGKLALHDPDGNAGQYTLHNHFVIKSLQHTAPGGMVAVLASRHLMDARNPSARRDIAALGDLVGALRLPAGTHRAVAGTDVVSDLLIFQRHLAADTGRPGGEWVHSVPVDVDGEQLSINRYFVDHPGRILGSMSAQHRPHLDLGVTARGNLNDIPEEVDGALRDITDRALARGVKILEALDLTPRPQPTRVSGRASEHLQWEGHMAPSGEGFTIVRGGTPEPLVIPRRQQAETRALLELRDGAQQLLELESTSGMGLDDARQRLRLRYEAYVQQWGAINRFTEYATGRVAHDGSALMARRAPGAVARLSSDPFGPLVKALEVFDEASRTATPAQILLERVLEPRELVACTDDPDEAIAVCLDRFGRLSVEDLADLLGQDPGAVPAVLGDRVFQDPQSGELQPAAEYLCGDVRAKLKHARALQDERPELARHVAALTAVLPPDVPLEDIEARLGAAWIDADTHRQFLAELLGDDRVYVEHAGGSTWAVRGNKHSVAATVQWGTQRMPATAIAELVMQQKPVVVKDATGDGNQTVVNPQETAAAIDKGEQLQERFSEWVWEDPQRAGRLHGEYNRRFNSVTLRDYSTAGDRLTLPGLARTFTPRPHQRAGVARMLGEPTVGLFHEVGAGKTATMVIGTMELRRLGMVRKPAVVVPNHMLEQFSREWLALYPKARLLAAGSHDLTKDRRRDFVARIAAHDWDAIVMTRGAFERLSLRPENVAAYIDEQVEGLQEQLQRANASAGKLTVKRLEARLQSHSQKTKKLMDTPVDPGISFEDAGIDYLVVDEAHDYKNLTTASKIPGASIGGSDRATDLASKLDYLRARHGARVATLATATPIANSITEAHVVMRYMRPDRLKAAGIDEFDAWAATFARTVSGVEITADGAGFQQKTRFARFQNVPEMLSTWHTFADVKTAEDLQLPRPDLAVNADGKREPQTIVVPPSAATSDYVAQLAARAEAVRGGLVDPTDDNMLKISTDGRKAALDMRLIDASQSSADTTKLEVVANQIAADWAEHRDSRYLDPATDQLSETPGGLQIVFCDLSTPRETWNAYDELRDQLTERGLPREQVRFIHDAKNDAEKARLFAACRSGQVAVIIGSTTRMGVGTNIQARAISLHHIDCPWRPADVQQRDGRALRQGNQNDEIRIYRYVTENSFDAFSWQTVARKMGFTRQVMRGNHSLRNVEDISQEELTAHQVVALASGNPLLMTKHQADVDLQHLQRVQRNHQKSQQQLRSRRAADLEAAATAGRRADRLTTALEHEIVSTRGDLFAAEIDGRHYTDRSSAAEALTELVEQRAVQLRSGRGPLGDLGRIGGMTLTGDLHQFPDGKQAVTIDLGDLPIPAVDADRHGLAGVSGSKLLRGLEHRLATLQNRRDGLLADEERHRHSAHQAVEQLAKPFTRSGELAAARQRVEELDRQIAAQAGSAATTVAEQQTELVRLATQATELAQRADQIPSRALDRALAIDAQLAELHARAHQPITGPQHYRDAVAQENAQRIASLTDAQQRLTGDLQQRTGLKLKELQAQRDALTRHRGEVETRAAELRDAIASHALDDPPAWIRKQLGERPNDDPAADQLWTAAVETAVTAQLHINPGAPLADGLPQRPSPHAQPHVSRALAAIKHATPGGHSLER